MFLLKHEDLKKKNEVGIDRLVCLEIELNIEHPNTIGFAGFNRLPQESYSKHGPQLVKKMGMSTGNCVKTKLPRVKNMNHPFTTIDEEMFLPSNTHVIEPITLGFFVENRIPFLLFQ